MDLDLITIYSGVPRALIFAVVDVDGLPIDITGATITIVGRPKPRAPIAWVGTVVQILGLVGQALVTVAATGAGSGTYQLWIADVLGVDPTVPQLEGRYIVHLDGRVP